MKKYSLNSISLQNVIQEYGSKLLCGEDKAYISLHNVNLAKVWTLWHTWKYGCKQECVESSLSTYQKALIDFDSAQWQIFCADISTVQNTCHLVGGVDALFEHCYM